MSRRPDERDMEQAVRSWMRDEDEHPADRNRQVGRIMGRIDETRQRRGAWRFLPFLGDAKPVDDGDEELYAAGRGELVTARGGVAPSLMALAAVLALVITAYAFLALRPSTAPVGPGATASPSPSPTIRPDDAELLARLESVWSGGAASLDDVAAVYAEEATTTTLWQDRTERSTGLLEIGDLIEASRSSVPTTWSPLPDGWGLQRRYLGVTADPGGSSCVVWVRIDRVSRQDCILPIPTLGDEITPGTPPEGVSRAGLEDLIIRAWRGDREAFDLVVSPDIVHHVAWNDYEVTHHGPELYWDVANPAGSTIEIGPEALAPSVDLPAPEGDLRWTDFSDVGGGSLCTFWAHGDQIIRHDCIVPTQMAYTG